MVSAVLVAVGALLLLVGLLSSSPLSGARTVLALTAAVGVYLFILVGRAIWRDLRNPINPKLPNEEEEGPHESQAPDTGDE